MNHVESRILIEELDTDGHSPMKFICSDGSMYFVKYRSGKSLDKKEINCLVFEMVCTKFLQQLHVPVPFDALVIINENSYVHGQLKVNKKYIKHGIIAWGSKEIIQADLVKEIEQVKKKTEFNKLHNPADLIRIAIFDLWVDNADRHAENYNLLVNMENGKLRIIAIDHAFTFGGLKGMNIFNASTEPHSYKKLIESQYFRSVVKHFDRRDRFKISSEFLSLIVELNLEKLINEVFEQIPSQWGINPILKKRIIDFLQSKQRITSIQQICNQQLQKNFRRKKS